MIIRHYSQQRTRINAMPENLKPDIINRNFHPIFKNFLDSICFLIIDNLVNKQIKRQNGPSEKKGLIDQISHKSTPSILLLGLIKILNILQTIFLFLTIRAFLHMLVLDGRNIG